MSRSQSKDIVSRIIQATIAGIILLIIGTYLYQNSSLFYRNDIDWPFFNRLNKQDLYLIKGEEFKLRVLSINKRVAFSTTNFRVAGVNFNGRVRGHQTGRAYIIAKVKDKQLKCRVHVLDINKKNLNLSVGKSFKLDIKGINAYVHWRSSNPRVATISMFGKIKARSPGSTVVTARVKGKVLRCTVQVN